MFPPIPLDLLKALDAVFPERSPTPDESYEDLRWRGGQRSVIHTLRRVYEEQNENVLNTDVIPDVSAPR